MSGVGVFDLVGVNCIVSGYMILLDIMFLLSIGEKFGLFGLNGLGKLMLFSIMVGLIRF